MKNRELRNELRLFIKQFIEPLNENAREYFYRELDKILEKYGCMEVGLEDGEGNY